MQKATKTHLTLFRASSGCMWQIRKDKWYMNDYKCFIIADSTRFEDVLKITKEKLQELIIEVEKYETDFETNNDDITTINLSEALAKVSVMIKQVVYLTECDDDYEEYIRFELNKQVEEINNKKKGVTK